MPRPSFSRVANGPGPAAHVRGLADAEVMQQRRCDVDDGDPLLDHFVVARPKPEQALRIVVATANGVNHVEQIAKRLDGSITAPADRLSRR